MKVVAIDGRMWGEEFTGIGKYLSEICPRIFKIFPKTEFRVFVPNNFSNFSSFSKNVKFFPTHETIYSLSEQFSFAKKISQAAKNGCAFFPHFNVPLFFRGKFMVTIHDLTILRFPGKKMNKFWHRLGYRLVLKNAIKNSEKIITVSNFVKKEILHFFNISDDKISVIYNGVDRKKFSNPNKKLVQKFQKKFGNCFLIAGNWRNHKNIPNAIFAFEKFCEMKVGDWNLVITGKEDKNYYEVFKIAKKSIYSQKIFFSGFLDSDEIPAIFSAAGALVFPSFSEGFGLPAIEAFSAGIPVLAAKCSSLPEICGLAALFFDPKNTKDITDKMVQIVKNKNLQNQIITAGKNQLEKFSWKNAAQELAENFETLM